MTSQYHREELELEDMHHKVQQQVGGTIALVVLYELYQHWYAFRFTVGALLRPVV